jgi:hypothetical protein
VSKPDSVGMGVGSGFGGAGRIGVIPVRDYSINFVTFCSCYSS